MSYGTYAQVLKCKYKQVLLLKDQLFKKAFDEQSWKISFSKWS